jgi:hypothetical protein
VVVRARDEPVLERVHAQALLDGEPVLERVAHHGAARVLVDRNGAALGGRPARPLLLEAAELVRGTRASAGQPVVAALGAALLLEHFDDRLVLGAPEGLLAIARVEEHQSRGLVGVVRDGEHLAARARLVAAVGEVVPEAVLEAPHGVDRVAVQRSDLLDGEGGVERAFGHGRDDRVPEHDVAVEAAPVRELEHERELEVGRPLVAHEAAERAER